MKVNSQKKKEGGEEKSTNLKEEERIMSKRGEKTQMNYKKTRCRRRENLKM